MADSSLRRRRVRHAAVVGSISLVALALVPLVAAVAARPDDRSLGDSYLATLAITAIIQVVAIAWLACEYLRHRHRQTRVPIGPTVTGGSADHVSDTVSST